MSSIESEDQDGKAKGRVTFKFFIFLLFSIIIASVSVQNMHVVDVYYYDLLFERHVFHAPLLAVVFVSISCGFLLAWIFGVISQFKLKSRIRRQNKSLEKMSVQLDNLQARPTETAQVGN